MSEEWIQKNTTKRVEELGKKKKLKFKESVTSRVEELDSSTKEQE